MTAAEAGLLETAKSGQIAPPGVMSEAWTHAEVEAAVADYFDMLARELRREPFNKAEHNRRLQQILQNRTRGSVERKHQNISAVLIELGYPYIDGYKPLRKVPVRRNNLELEARNQSLGRAGEELVLRFEHERLWRARQRTLADRLEHVSQTKGDHLGFDIHSFETDGRDRLIEVKTTRFGAMTPFFASRNEVIVSEVRESEFQLYRLFSFREQPKLFVLPGCLRNTCRLEAVSFSALPR